MQDPQQIYYQSFNDSDDNDQNDLPHGTYLIDLKTVNIDEPYLESLEKYINAKVVVPNMEGMPVLEN